MYLHLPLATAILGRHFYEFQGREDFGVSKRWLELGNSWDGFGIAITWSCDRFGSNAYRKKTTQI